MKNDLKISKITKNSIIMEKKKNVAIDKFISAIIPFDSSGKG